MAKLVEAVINVNEVSRISRGTSIKGEMTSESDIRVDGKVEGKLISKGKIVVGESAEIKGTIACSTVDFWGSIEGEIYASELLSVKSTAVITGNIYVRQLQVEMGAKINGSCHMIDEDEFQKLTSAVQE